METDNRTSAGPGSELAVEDMITHLDEMFEDDAKNHDEFFDQFSAGSAEPSPEINSEHWPEEDEWYE
jgi:hypothetical protein